MKEKKISIAAGLLAGTTALSALTGCTSSQPAGKTGVYYGESQGFGGTVSAEVTFDNGRLQMSSYLVKTKRLHRWRCFGDIG